jgi:NAD(P)-dependent dehydrogenase (short-subunit alcohol dehydrogenase family)
MKRFPKKRVFITGAGSGLGRALSIEFAKMGWRIGIADIDKKRSAETAKLVESAGGNGLIIHCDVTKEADFKNALKILLKEWGGIDIVLNNAGVPACGYMEEIPASKWEWIININLKSIINSCRTFIPILKKQNNGYIVNTASYLGYISTPESTCYNMTKAGIISLSETLNVELIKDNIGVSVVMPSFFVTNFMDNLFAAGERQQKMVTTLFSKSSFTAEQVAKCIVKGIKKKKLFIIPQFDAKVLWVFKRWFPEFYFKFFQFVYKKGFVEKFFGIED